MVSSGQHVWGTRARTPAEALNKDDEDKVTKKKTKASSGAKNGSTVTQRTNSAKKSSGGTKSSKGGEVNLLAPVETEVDAEIWQYLH